MASDALASASYLFCLCVLLREKKIKISSYTTKQTYFFLVISIPSTVAMQTHLLSLLWNWDWYRWFNYSVIQIKRKEKISIPKIFQPGLGTQTRTQSISSDSNCLGTKINFLWFGLCSLSLLSGGAGVTPALPFWGLSGVFRCFLGFFGLFWCFWWACGPSGLLASLGARSLGPGVLGFPKFWLGLHAFQHQSIPKVIA